jgi:aminoglycoside N3'-acetyltransferase
LATIWQKLSVSRDQVRVSITNFVAALPKHAPVVVHSDLSRAGAPEGVANADECLHAWMQILLEAVEGRPLLIPTFNYDYCRTRLFDPLTDTGQVGALSSFCVRDYAKLRTSTPIFNFCIFNNDSLCCTPLSNPFGTGSTFAEIHRRNAAIVFLGVNLRANTFVHYVEELLNVGYRYPKPFPGEVLVDGHRVALDFVYRVRPLVPNAVEYGDMGEDDVEAAGLLTTTPVGRSFAKMVRAQEYVEVITEAISKNELHLLTPRARVITQQLYDKLGRPLSFEKMEC